MSDHEGHDLKTRGWPDGDNPTKASGHQPNETALATDLAAISSTRYKAAKQKIECALEVNGRKYTKRQLEHFGDAVLDMAAREMAHAKTGDRQHIYFMYVGRLCTNANLTYGGHDGTAWEILIGRVYAVAGLTAALAKAVSVITHTWEWKHFLKVCEDTAVLE